MLEWAWPWLALLWPLPWLVSRALPAIHSAGGAALRVPYALKGLEEASGGAAVPRWRTLLAWCAWTALIVAAARPQWLGEPQALPRSGRDLLLAGDASRRISTPGME